MEIEKDRMERRKLRKRMKNKAAPPSGSTSATQGAETETDKKPEEGGDLEDESVYRKRELEELEALISPDVKADIGASATGLYELVGTYEPPLALGGKRTWLQLIS